jgi:hypothetical protein
LSSWTSLWNRKPVRDSVVLCFYFIGERGE